MKSNKNIEQLIEDFELMNPLLANIVSSLRKIVLEVVPKFEEKIMYGGIVFFISDRMFCGIFQRKKYVTVEFDRGYEMDNKLNHLEGSGKYRRHLKIYNKEDIKKKIARHYILESYRLGNNASNNKLMETGQSRISSA
ncbi:DUF1801 domain-containing protein [candidate division WOR-3 bacterium]|nr:DUF1801 domain-containing protein [candidate division WOR-3 bacterium]